MTSEWGVGSPYGYGLAAFGAGLAGFSWYVIQSTPMTALGIGIAVVGGSIAITPTAPVPSKTVRKLLEGSLANIEALLEDTGATKRGYYVPASLAAEGVAGEAGDHGGKAPAGGVPVGGVRVFVPLREGEEKVPSSWRAGGLVVELEGMQYLVVHPPGYLLLENEELSGDLESLMHEYLVEQTGLVESVRVVEGGGSSVLVELKRPRTRTGHGRVARVLGSLEAGTAAVIAASAKGRVARVASEYESVDGKRKRAVIELL